MVKSFSKVMIAVIAFSLVMAMANCSGDKSTDNSSAASNYDPMNEKGIGPITSVTLGELDHTLADKGKKIFAEKCTPCHNTPDIDAKKIGPSVKGVTKRRTPEWIMNQLLNPVEMSQKDPIAKEEFAKYKVMMVYMGLTNDDARAVLEFLRESDK